MYEASAAGGVVGHATPWSRTADRVGQVRLVVEVLADVGRVEPAGMGMAGVVDDRLAQHDVGARQRLERRRHGEADLDMRQVG